MTGSCGSSSPAVPNGVGIRTSSPGPVRTRARPDAFGPSVERFGLNAADRQVLEAGLRHRLSAVGVHDACYVLASIAAAELNDCFGTRACTGPSSRGLGTASVHGQLAQGLNDLIPHLSRMRTKSEG